MEYGGNEDLSGACEFLESRIRKVFEDLENTVRYKNCAERYESKVEIVRTKLPDYDAPHMEELVRCFIDILILTQNYFYIMGFDEGLRMGARFPARDSD